MNDDTMQIKIQEKIAVWEFAGQRDFFNMLHSMRGDAVDCVSEHYTYLLAKYWTRLS